MDTYVVAGIADHITPWTSCYRSVHLLGSEPRFVLSTSGHIAAMVNPPGNEKATFRVNDALPADADEWLAGATMRPGQLVGGLDGVAGRALGRRARRARRRSAARATRRSSRRRAPTCWSSRLGRSAGQAQREPLSSTICSKRSCPASPGWSGRGSGRSVEAAGGPAVAAVHREHEPGDGDEDGDQDDDPHGRRHTRIRRGARSAARRWAGSGVDSPART